MHILLATDADWIVDQVTAALGGPDTSFTVCRDGHLVAKTVADRDPDLVIADLQVGSMGGMAITMTLHHAESAGRLAHVPVVMLLDRTADVYLAQRSQAESWLIKPLDALRLRRAATAAVAGESYTEGIPEAVIATDGDTPDGADEDEDETDVAAASDHTGTDEPPDGEDPATTEEEPANAG